MSRKLLCECTRALTIAAAGVEDQRTTMRVDNLIIDLIDKQFRQSFLSLHLVQGY